MCQWCRAPLLKDETDISAQNRSLSVKPEEHEPAVRPVGILIPGDRFMTFEHPVCRGHDKYFRHDSTRPLVYNDTSGA